MGQAATQDRPGTGFAAAHAALSDLRRLIASGGSRLHVSDALRACDALDAALTRAHVDMRVTRAEFSLALDRLEALCKLPTTPEHASATPALAPTLATGQAAPANRASGEGEHCTAPGGPGACRSASASQPQAQDASTDPPARVSQLDLASRDAGGSPNFQSSGSD